MNTNVSRLTRWAQPAPDMGPAVYCLTAGPGNHKHTYHLYCPWSEDGRKLLLLRYDHINPDAEVCLLDTDSGNIRPLVDTTHWESHTAAHQQWQGNRNRIFYLSADDSGPAVATMRPDGSDKKVIPCADAAITCCSPDGRWAYGTTDLARLFPEDEIAPRHDKGIVRIDLDSGQQELVLSMEQVLELVPDAEEISGYHLFPKMTIVHKGLPRVLFGVVNNLWAVAGLEPRIHLLISMGRDGADPVYIGNYKHHPNWHPNENLILSNIADCNDNTRLGLFDGDGKDLPHYIPHTKGSGHPSYSPDARWICTDGGGPNGNRIIICDPTDGSHTVAMEHDSPGGGYASMKAVKERGPNETVIAAFGKRHEYNTWQTQCHPAWSPDGTAILFNADTGGGSQLYVIDVQQTL